MKTYILQAKLGESITTVAINARDLFGAKVSAAQKISANCVSDKRFAIGEITLKDPDKKVVYKLEEEKKEGK